MQVERQTKTKTNTFLTKLCWSPKYKVPVLSTCRGSHPEGFIVAIFCNAKHIGNNNNNENNNDNNNKLSIYRDFHLSNLYFPVSTFLFC